MEVHPYLHKEMDLFNHMVYCKPWSLLEDIFGDFIFELNRIFITNFYILIWLLLSNTPEFEQHWWMHLSIYPSYRQYQHCCHISALPGSLLPSDSGVDRYFGKLPFSSSMTWMVRFHSTFTYCWSTQTWNCTLW